MDKNKPVKPNISCDGWYPYCPSCNYFDLSEEQDRCPSCDQAIDWSWTLQYKINRKNR